MAQVIMARLENTTMAIPNNRIGEEKTQYNRKEEQHTDKTIQKILDTKYNRKIKQKNTLFQLTPCRRVSDKILHKIFLPDLAKYTLFSSRFNLL